MESSIATTNFKAETGFDLLSLGRKKEEKNNPPESKTIRRMDSILLFCANALNEILCHIPNKIGFGICFIAPHP